MQGNLLVKAKSQSANPAAETPSASTGSFAWPLAIAALFGGLLAIWHGLDHALPMPDDASYILASFKYADLLHHAKFWKPDWWHMMLTVNQAYPPTVMFFNGVLRLVFGTGNFVNILSVVLYDVILTLSVFHIANLLLKNRTAALISAVVVNLYPITTSMAHGFALDFPLLSMISLGLFMLTWWRSQPTWGRAIMCGVALGFCCLTKQIAAAYLLPTGLYLLGETVFLDFKTKNWTRSLQVFSIAALTAAVGLPWLLSNLAFLRQWSNNNQVNMGHLTLAQVFPDRIIWYAHSLPSIMSPVLCACFAMSVLFWRVSPFRLLLPISLSAVGGVMLISTLTWVFPSVRYDAPIVVATAVWTGAWLATCAEQPLGAVFVAAIGTVCALQFAAFNFAPYPIRALNLASISERLGVEVREVFGLTERDRREMRILHSTPNGKDDWGQQWILETIRKQDGDKPAYLNILPEVATINANTMSLVCAMTGSKISPTTSRKWTVMGDCVEFDPTVAMYYQWYLLKDGYQGPLIKDDQSLSNYKKLNDYVKHSGRFALVATHKLPDDSTMYLYRQR